VWPAVVDGGDEVASYVAACGLERVRLEEKGRDDGAGLREKMEGERPWSCVCVGLCGEERQRG